VTVLLRIDLTTVRSVPPPSLIVRVRLDVVRAHVVRCASLALATASVLGAFSAEPARSDDLGVSMPAPGGVFIVLSEPQKLTSRASQLRVRFSTTGRAQSGWEYYVYMLMQERKPKGEAKARCAWKAASWNPSMVEHIQHIRGVPGPTYTVVLRAAKMLGGHFCSGPAVLQVGTGPTGHLGDRRRPLHQLRLTIAPAR